MIYEGDNVYCRDCKDFGPAEAYPLTVAPDRIDDVPVCSHCGSTNIIPAEEWWEEREEV